MNSNHKEQTVVGIGASAGGLEALRLLIPNLPVQADIAYIIAQHLDPKHSSMLRDILARENEIPIKEIDDKETLEGGVLYIIPPGKDAYLKQQAIHLQSATGIGPKPSIDRIFISMSEEYGEQAVGIVLSGTGTDGAHGIRAIKAEGGITITQDERSAKFPSMPMAAVETGNVDLILPPESIGSRLPSLIQHPRHLPELLNNQLEDNDYLGKILLLLFNQTGSDFREYKQTTIYRRIERRMAIHKIFSLAAYLELLNDQPEELNHLHQDVLISVTDFFRDSDAFLALGENFSQVINEERKEIRVWVCGCATGQEAYSIAILLAEHLGNRLKQFNIQIFATDLDEEALATARQGRYPKSIMANVDQSLLDKYFTYSSESWQLKNNIRDMVLFAKHNVIKDPPFSHLDLISCRNLLIYFNNDLQRRVLQLFHYALRNESVLFLGKSETTGAHEQLFFPVDRKQRLYRKRGEIRSHIPSFNLGLNKPNFSPESHHISHADKERDLPSQMMNNRIIEIYAPQCILLDDLHNITFVRGDVSSYLKFNEGRMGLSIFDLIHPTLRQELRGLLYKARREHDTLVKTRKLLMNNPDNNCYCHIKARFYERESEFMILFEKEPEPTLPTIQEQDQELNQQFAFRIQSLEEELKETSESLQTTIEELETSNEELQSTYEEAQSTNEELYTSTEELQTSNEELQSANEELRTLNEEISTKSIELEKANERLHQEIEERQRIEDELRLQERKLRRIIDAEPAWVNICNQRGDILHVNPAGIEIMEADGPDQLLNKTLHDFALSGYQSEVVHCQNSLNNGEPSKHLIEIRTCKGNHRWIEISSVILPDEGEGTRFMSIITDQTHHKKTELELMQRREELSHITRLNTLGAMTSSIAHEINQPLAAISSYISGCENRLQQNGCNDGELLETIVRTRSQVSRAGDIINHIKNFIKHERSDNQAVQINESVYNAIRLLKDSGQLSNIEPQLQLATDLPTVLARSTQIEQVIINFIMNALEAMSETEQPTLQISTALTEAKNVKLSVKDNGVGIASEDVDKIFKPFFTTKQDGMGMGLSISHSIIESYAGECHATNNPDGGISMSFTLPRINT